jgi:proteic killer suppression protein
MIRSSKHKGLERFITKGSTAGIQNDHKARLEERLQALRTAFSVEDMNIPEWHLHALKGDRGGQWAINVSGNWRIVFEFEGGHAYVVNYEDYH